MKLRIVYEGGRAGTTKVINADTGELLDGVLGVHWEIPADPPGWDKMPHCVITLRAVPVDLTVDMPELQLRVPQRHRTAAP